MPAVDVAGVFPVLEPNRLPVGALLPAPPKRPPAGALLAEELAAAGVPNVKVGGPDMAG